MSAVEILRQARELIADKNRWTQGAYARDELGNMQPPREEDVVCWCAIGALEKVCGDDIGLSKFHAAYDVLVKVSNEIYGAGLAQVNDGRVNLLGKVPHEAVLWVYDEAARAAEAANA